MRWTRGNRSEDLEDRRGESPGRGGLRVGGGIGLGGAVILLVLSLVFGQNFFALLDGGGELTPAPGGGAPTAPPRKGSPAEEQAADFMSFVLDDVQSTWAREFTRLGQEYERAKLVLFTDAVRSGCGAADAAAGPFYCPEDRKVYIDLGFYNDLKNRFGAPGDFAQAYVLAHEIGHHVQHLLGLTEQVRGQQARPDRANALSVRLELQADCLAGVWAHSTSERQLLEEGDVEEDLHVGGESTTPPATVSGSAAEPDSRRPAGRCGTYRNPASGPTRAHAGTSPRAAGPSRGSRSRA